MGVLVYMCVFMCVRAYQSGGQLSFRYKVFLVIMQQAPEDRMWLPVRWLSCPILKNHPRRVLAGERRRKREGGVHCSWGEGACYRESFGLREKQV